MKNKRMVQRCVGLALVLCMAALLMPCFLSSSSAHESVTRLAGSNRFDTAFQVADAMKAELGIDQFDTIIVSSGINFPDALSGSYLAAVKNAPILLSFNEKYNNLAKDYIIKNLKPGGTVYLLGGSDAVPESLREGLEDFQVKRLAGGNRFETNLEVLKEANVGDKPILVCTGLEFADSLSASASKLPILLVWKNLTDAQRAFLDNLNGNKFYIIGGENAVSSNMEAQMKTYGQVERIGGKNRFETSVLIAEAFFTDPQDAVLAYAWNFPDGLCGGGLAAAMDAPLILTMNKYEAKAKEYARKEGLSSGYVLGSGELIADDTVAAIFEAGQSSGSGPAISVASVNSSAGSEITVAVSVKNNPGILGMTLKLAYDESVLTLKRAENGSAASALTMTEPGKFQSGCNFVWDALELKEADIQDGEILLLTFDVSGTAPKGKYDIRISYNTGDIFDGDWNDLAVTVNNGTVGIS